MRLAGNRTMNSLTSLYRPPLGLLTDLYQLTMAYGYFRCGIQDRQAVFHLFFRDPPFRGGFTIACGLATVIDYLENLRFDEQDVAYLAELRGNDAKPLFERDFLDFLSDMSLICDVDGVAEGSVVFPHEPLLRVTGPLIQSQILETALLNIINFQTLVATKAARVAMAAGPAPVLEFGLRRAQGIDGAGNDRGWDSHTEYRDRAGGTLLPGREPGEKADRGSRLHCSYEPLWQHRSNRAEFPDWSRAFRGDRCSRAQGCGCQRRGPGRRDHRAA